MAEKKYVIFNKITGNYLAFCEMQPIWVSAKASATALTIDQVRLECLLTFNNEIKNIDWEVA